MAFEELTACIAPLPFILPIAGKQYIFPSEVSGWAWLTLTHLNNAGSAAAKNKDADLEQEVLNDLDEQRLMNEMFGGVEKELIADGVNSATMELVYHTLMMFHMYNRETAELYWNLAAKGKPEAVPLARSRKSATK